jgi:hypothetical protein
VAVSWNCHPFGQIEPPENYENPTDLDNAHYSETVVTINLKNGIDLAKENIQKK